MEPEPGNAGAGKQETLKESFGSTEALFFGVLINLTAKIKSEIGCSGFPYKE